MNSQWYSSIYEDWRPKIVENIENSSGETIKPGAVNQPELDPNRVILITDTVRRISLCYSRELARWGQ